MSKTPSVNLWPPQVHIYTGMHASAHIQTHTQRSHTLSLVWITTAWKCHFSVGNLYLVPPLSSEPVTIPLVHPLPDCKFHFPKLDLEAAKTSRKPLPLPVSLSCSLSLRAASPKARACLLVLTPGMQFRALYTAVILQATWGGKSLFKLPACIVHHSEEPSQGLQQRS